jgi:hypothetical protein
MWVNKCTQCGEIDYEAEDGYSSCCNKRVEAVKA